jgi:hypothetical protein
VVSVTPRSRFAPGKGPPVLIVQQAGWALESVWTQRLEEKSSAPAGDRTPIARSSSPLSDTILSELPRLLHTYLLPFKVADIHIPTEVCFFLSLRSVETAAEIENGTF